jgi:thiamine-phosphate pyrophosphorylase
MIQLREKHLDDRELIGRARILVERTRGSRTVAIVNDRTDMAAVVGADGVHVGQEDLSVKDARAIVGTRALIGVSTHNIEQARAAVLEGANYLGAGPTFASRTKAFDDFAGLDYLREISNEIRLPTFAIGGITPENLPNVRAAGAGRIAVSSAIAAAPNPAAAATEFLDALSGKPVPCEGSLSR